MKPIFLLAVLLTVSCAAHPPPVVVVVPPIVKLEPEPDRVRRTWFVPMDAKDDDLICAVSWLQLHSPCWQVGYLRSVMLNLKANPEF